MPTCPSCSQQVPPGARWCPFCHVHIVDPKIGKLASPGKRFVAFVLDMLITYIVFYEVLGLFRVVSMINVTGIVSVLILLLSIAIPLLILIAYIIWVHRHYSRGTTPCKHYLGMYVIRQNGERAGFWTMLIREWIGKLVSGLFYFIGFLWILLDKERQGWHDKMARTYVVEKPKT